MSEHAQPEMSDADVLSALQSAAAQDVATEQAIEAPPASQPAPVAGAPVEGEAPQVGDQAPEAPVAPEAEQSSIPDQVAPFNPDELPEELLPLYHQMQRAFTPRLQEAAEIRKTFEELGGLDTIQQAVDVYERIADPQNWPQLYEELYQAMEQSGFEFEDSTPGGATPPESPFGQVADDPDLAPIINELTSLRSRTAEQEALLFQLQEEQEMRQQMAEEELRQTQYLTNMSRQVGAIRQANPHYDDDDIRAIIEIGTFFGDDLATAQQRYEEHVTRRLNRYFEGKRAGAPVAVQPVAGAGVLSQKDSMPETVEEAAAQAEEFLRRLQAAGELDDLGL